MAPHAKKQALQQQIALSTLKSARWTIRQRADLTRELAILQKEEARLRSGEKVAEFKDLVSSYRTKINGMVAESPERGLDPDMHDAITAHASSDSSAKRARRRTESNRALRMSVKSGKMGCEPHSLMDEIGGAQDLSPDQGILYLERGDTCPECSCALVASLESRLSCMGCGYSMFALKTHQSQSYDDDNQNSNTATFLYRRDGHMGEWLRGAMATTTAVIPEDVYASVCKYLYEVARVRNPKKINRDLVLDALRANKQRRYYGKAPLIASKLSGISPHRLTPQQEEQLKDMFGQIQATFDHIRQKVCPNRRNFMSYSYAIRKACQLLGLEEFANNFSLLKGKDKLSFQDKIWKAICAELNWTYYPSV
jgi:ribosomal protein S27AE